MGSRENLQIELEAVLGSRNVYFQPPSTIKMKYPAIVYSLGGIHSRYADNKNYINGKNYTVTLIHNDPDNEVIDEILIKFEYCSFDRMYVMDNLYHYAFEIFY